MSDINLSENAAKALELIEGLSVLEAADLVKAMEEKFGVSAAAPVAVAAVAGGDAGAAAEEAKDEFDVMLTGVGDKKIQVIKEVRAITGRIDLVHANDSRDDFDSGADRHTSFGAGRIDPDLLAAVVRDAAAPVVCETPGPAESHVADFEWLRARL